jgi:PAS domain S-box-containing protein
VQAKPNITILLVDDVHENLELLEDLLPEYGFGTRTASSGLEALDQLKNNDIHVIISDAMMPKMDGFEFCKLVKKDPAYASIPFIIYTGDYVDPEDEELAKSIGVDRYIEKMSGIDTLVDTVKEIVLNRYGLETREGRLDPEQLDDQSFLERHHALVVKKLEQKMNELEMFAQTLSRKNRELQVSEARYRGLFEQANVAIYVLQRNTFKVLDVNKLGLALLGYSREDLVALSCFPFEKSEANALVKFQNQEEYFGESVIVARDGKPVQVELSAGTFGTGDESKILLFVRDITEQKKIREMLAQAEKLSLMGTLASGIAHEIRNPLAAVTLNLQYLEQKLAGVPSSYDSVVSALEGARRIETVIDNTLGLARMKPPELNPHHVNDIIRQALGFVQLVIQQKNLTLETHLEENLPTIHVDARQIQQVLINVLQNAVDATPVGTAIVVKTYHIEDTPDLIDAKPAARRVVVSIRDAGSGIPPERMKDLFEPFKTTKSGGTGLGLALSKRILDRHNAAIHIESAEGGGTVVRLMFSTQMQNER